MGTRTSSRARFKSSLPATEAASPAAPAQREFPRRLPPVLAAVVVFVASGAVLVLEILAVRLLAPYVGLTLETTTSIIGAVLAGIAVGAALGGRVADRVNSRRLLAGLFIGGGLLVLLTVPIIRWLGPGAGEGGNAAAIGVTFAALVPMAAVLSGVTPTVARLQLHDLRASGTVVGGLSAWATAGALTGTFGTGFLLVPLLPVSTTVLAIGVLLVILGVVLGAYLGILTRASLLLAALAGLGMATLTLVQHSPCLAESAYHCIQLAEDPERVSAEYLLLDRGYNSDIDKTDPKYLGFQYERWFGEAIDAIGRAHAPLTGVFVGGGAFTMPRWLAATRPGSRSSTLEVDSKLVEFDRRRLGLRTSPSLRVVVGDARLTMRREPARSADIVVGDAFSSRTVPWQLMTSEWLREVKRVLKPGGVYLLNMIDLRPLRLLRAEAATLLAAFRNARLTTVAGEDGRPLGGNEVMIASDGPLPRTPAKPVEGAHTFERAALAGLVRGATRLRDDDAPVDQLETR